MSKSTKDLKLADMTPEAGIKVDAMKPNDTAITSITVTEFPTIKEGLDNIVRQDFQ